MDGEILHYLDGVRVEEPKGWGDFEEELDRDVRERLISTKYATSLTFTGDGYEYLNGLFTTDGYCGSVQYEAKQWCGDVLTTATRGVIILADVRFNETRCEAECDIADDGAGARVVNNKEIPVSPTAQVTKNGDALTDVSSLAVDMFTSSGGGALTVKSAYDWFDCIQHAVLYITDNNVPLVSSWYNALPDEERYFVATGFAVRTGNTPASTAPLVYDFKRLFLELAMKYNLWLCVERNVDGTPYLRMEPEGYFFGATGTIVHPNIQDLVRSTDTDRLWAKVNVGSDKFIKEQGTAFALPYLVLRGFTKEEFHFSGVCNTSDTLDLVNELVIDTNVIQDVVENGNDEYDDDIFLVQYNKTTLQATQGTYLDPGNAPYLYNEPLQNGTVLNRYDLPSPVGIWYGNTDTSFEAWRTDPGGNEFYPPPAGTSSFSIVQFDDDYTAPGFDPSNSWGNGTVQGNPVSQANSRYTAQAQGFYEFTANVRWRIVSNVPVTAPGPLTIKTYKTIRPQVQVERYNAGGTLIGAPVTLGFTTEYAPGVYVANGTVGLSLDVGDYVQVVYQFVHSIPQLLTPFSGPLPNPFTPSGVTVRLDAGSTILTSFVTGGGYVGAGGQARIIKYEFDRPIDLATWVSLTASPRDIIGIGGGPSVQHNTHLLNAKRNVKTGATTWAVIKRP